MPTHCSKCLVLVIAVLLMPACAMQKTSDATVPKNAGGAENQPQAITGVVWMLKRFDAESEPDSFVIDDPARYTLALLPNDQYRVTADCNRMQGGYSVDGDRISLASGAATLAECGPSSRYADYLRRLAEVVRFEVINQHQLNLFADSGVLVFDNEALEIDQRAQSRAR